ncbi:MAG: DUF4433 domain-containing protein [Deltaproteobacteria bacterium]|nr:DUF4433 domain-containing protein [Deltaproteobacteria bacterium]MBW2341264.1 DUF4433 domain-containing protein [Deltaproteobacteria bacterium]
MPTPVYHLTHVVNLSSIIQSGGCLSFNQKQDREISHVDIAYERIQDRRARTLVPCGPRGCLHDYVPFFFAPRPPMLYAIHAGYVEGYEQGQAPLIHLVTTAQAVNNSGSEWVFADGHATMTVTEFFDDLDDLDQVDWEVMESRYWNDTPTLPDRKRRRQAEFLVKDFCPWELFSEIGVINSKIESRVKRMVENSRHQPVVQIHRDWYY